MIDSIQFKNFRVLKDTKLPLTPCTLILGPNGSGKSTALAGLRLMRDLIQNPHTQIDVPRNLSKSPTSQVMCICAKTTINGYSANIELTCPLGKQGSFGNPGTQATANYPPALFLQMVGADDIRGSRFFSFDPRAIAQNRTLIPAAELQADGAELPNVLTALQDQNPERFENLNKDLEVWLPGFDRLLFNTPAQGQRGILLRTKPGGHRIPAVDLSDGTLMALCLLALIHIPNPPSVVCLEDPDHGLHPRLLRQVHDAMMRLSNPADYGDNRKPVQVIATTHSPYLLDCFKNHPEDVVIAEKTSEGAMFRKLISMDHYDEIMHDSPLGDAWYSGILGGVPVSP